MSRQTAKIDPAKLTPMMQQYFDMKQQWPDCILFFRLGDFYEMFFDDAVTAAKVLELTLTGRDCGQEERAPMCGVPHHAASSYINRLINRGFKVAICEQVEDPAQAKGIVKREVIRVITPGTQIDPAMLDERKNNYIMAIYALSRYFGLAICDLTTGVFEATALVTGATEAKLIDEVVRFQPSEIICNKICQESPVYKLFTDNYNIMTTIRPDEDFALEQVPQQLPDLEREEQQPLWTQAAAALLAYLTRTQRVRPGHLQPVKAYTVDDFMNLDPNARRNLELTETMRDRGRRGSLLWAIDKTVTSIGGRMLRRWLEQPLLNTSLINRRLEAVTELKEKFIVRQSLRDALDGLYDLERLTGKVALQTVNARDLLALRQTLACLPALREILAQLQDPWLIELQKNIDDLPRLCRLLQDSLQEDPPISLKEGGIIRGGYDEEVDRLRLAATEGKNWIIELEKSEREKTGIKSLKVGYNRVFGYYIEVTRTNLAQVPDSYVRKQTLANGERYITPELKEMEDTILGAEQKVIALEYDLFCQIREKVAGEITSLQNTARSLALIDVLQGLAELADRDNYCRPQVDLSDRLVISRGRHPVVEKTLGPGSFVPNDLNMDMQDRRVMILTGPNMAGKSTYMRQIAQIVLLAQIGSFVPAQSAHIGLVDRIFTRVGASDDLASGQSTFMVEMTEVAQILEHASGRSLLILDEIGRGTSTYDGLSIAWSVIEYVVDRHNLGSRTLFATHYHELTDLAGILPGVINCHVEVSEQGGEVVFLHRIADGGSDDSYGIEVARLAGVPASVVQRATEILIQLEKENLGKSKLKVRSNARPMDGQIDLFSSSSLMQKAETIVERLQNVDIQNLTPLDALNILHDLKQKAGSLEKRQKGNENGQNSHPG